MPTMRTPGVYIVEKNAFPNSVVEVATAVPAFIGYTEKAEKGGSGSLLKKPTRITSLNEYQSMFGGAPVPVFRLGKGEKQGSKIDNTDFTLVAPANQFTLYYNLMFFFANGGGPCYIVSVGNYAKGISADELKDGIELLKREQEPTMLVIPEAVNLGEKCYSLQQAMLQHCGYEMKNRFAILDIPQLGEDAVKQFREKIGSNNLPFGAAYYPWLKTSIIDDSQISEKNIQFDALLKEFISKDTESWKDEDLLKLINRMEPPVVETASKNQTKTTKEENKKADEKEKTDVIALNDNEKKYLHSVLMQNATSYKSLFQCISQYLNQLPPSAAMAGLYTMTDNSRGVWKAPANMSINGAIAPTLSISYEEQEDLNVPLSGKAVNAIRSFPGEGIKVWGARTLDGNSLDNRYINVRRTLIFLEESIKNAARAFVFDPNTVNTWVNVKSMINNFLTGIWKRGGLAGSVPEDAFSVFVGLGETMTPEDVLEGIMRVNILIALVRPAEFIEITFQQQMQES